MREGTIVTYSIRVRPLWAVAAFAVFVGAASLPAAAADMTPELQKVIAGAKAEGSLHLSYASNILGGADGARLAAKAIKEKYGVSLDINFTPGPSFAQMATKLYTEMQAQQKASTDVYNGTAVQVSPYLSRGLWRSIEWTKLYPGRITAEIAEADGRALRVVTSLSGVLYNKNTAPEFGKIVTMNDLLKPQYKGKVFTTPYLAGFDVLLADDVWGYDKTLAYVQKLSKQVGGLMPCAATDRIASGEVPGLAIDCSGSEENTAKYKNVLGHVIIHDAAMRRYNYLCIPKNAEHPNAAILFGLYASSPEGQRDMAFGLFGADLDTYPEAQTHARVAALQKVGVKFTDVTIDWWTSQKNVGANLKKLTAIIRKR